MDRRDFIQKSLIISGAFTLNPKLSFAENPSEPEFTAPGGTNFFRKNPRPIVERVPGFIWLDAADFEDYGGWWIDTQYTHLMGSSYLTANGVDEPVSSAKTKIKVSRSGRYRIHVRTRNWHRETSPGRFTLLLDGEAVGPEFGVGSDTWHWESTEAIDLKKGALSLELKDLSGYFARCSSILITRDLDFTPAEDLHSFLEERAKYSGYSLKPVDAGKFDFVVVGAGCAGVCAAIAAARRGLKVALISDRPVLGGNVSIEVGIGAVGAAHKHPNARETGLLDDIFQRSFASERGSNSALLLKNVEAEPNITLLIHESVDGVESHEDGRIRSVLMTHTLEGTRKRVKAPLFLDSSGDSWLGHHAGAEYRFGREARDEFNEPWAPEKADDITMAGCLRDGRDKVFYRVQDMGKPDPFSPPKCTHVFAHKDTFMNKRNINRGRLRTGEWWLEHPGDWDDLLHPEEARDELYRLTLGYWNWLKNHSPFQKELSHFRLVEIPHYVGKRETRRLVGDHIMSAYDSIEAKRFKDTVGMAGWSFDVHHPLGLLSSEGPFDYNPKVPIHGFPFRILYSKNVNNLFMAGRNVSCTHTALGTLRVQRTTALMGEVVGTAAAMCRKYDTLPRQLGGKHVFELQQELMLNDNYLPGFVNEDAEDLARGATVSASSTFSGDLMDTVVLDEEPLELDFPRAAQIRWKGGEHMKTISIRIRNTREVPVSFKVDLEGSVFRADFKRGEFRASRDVEIPAKFDGWFPIPIQKPIWGHYYILKIPAVPGVFWFTSPNAPSGEARAFGKNLKKAKGLHAVVTDPSFMPSGSYQSENVVNGVTRIIKETPNYWASDPREALPQYVQLDLEQKAAIRSVHLTFDTDLDAKYNRPYPKQCVRDYRIQALVNGKWSTLVTETKNGIRKRIHRFEPIETSAVRVVVDAMNGRNAAHIYEVRLYR